MHINNLILEAHKKMILMEKFKYGSISLSDGYKEEDYEAVVNNYYAIKNSKHKLIKASEISEGDVIFMTVTDDVLDDTIAVKGRVDKVTHNELGEVVVDINGVHIRFEDDDNVFLTQLKKK